MALNGVYNAGQALSVIAQALGVNVFGLEVASMAQALAPEPLLLILDNLEQLIQAALLDTLVAKSLLARRHTPAGLVRMHYVSFACRPLLKRCVHLA